MFLYMLTGAMLLLRSSGVFALTLNEAIQSANSSSPSILKSESAVNESLWKKRETYSGFLPSLTASAVALMDKKYALTNVRMGAAPSDTIVPQIIPTAQLTLASSYPLFEGFSSIHRLQSAIAQEQSAINEHNSNKFKTELDITLAFYKIVANKTLKEVSEQNLKVLQDHLKDIKLFKQSGMATNFDVLRVEVQVSNAETDLLNTIDNVSIAEQSLLELMGKDNKDFDINSSLPEIDDTVSAKFNEINLNSRQDLASLRNRALALDFNDRAMNSFWLPKLSLNGQYLYYNNLNNNITDTKKFRNAYQVGVMLTWNLFDGMISISRSQQASEQKFQAEKSVRLAELKAQKDLDIWKRKLNYFISLHKARKNDIAKSKESMRLAKEGRRVGARTSTDLLDAESDLYKSQAGAINAQMGAIDALINLELTSGQKIINL